MKLIIDISEEDYKFIKDLQNLIIGGRGNCKTIQQNVINAIRKGTAYRERRGEWIFDGVYRDENNPIDNDMYHCNLCKRRIMTACIRPEDLYPFCHCGADMRKGGAE